MPAYMKKPTVVQANQLTKELAIDNILRGKPLPPGMKIMKYRLMDTDDGVRGVLWYQAALYTEKVLHPIVEGDWIIQEEDGSFSVCERDKFDALYMTVEEVLSLTDTDVQLQIADSTDQVIEHAPEN